MKNAVKIGLLSLIGLCAQNQVMLGNLRVVNRSAEPQFVASGSSWERIHGQLIGHFIPGNDEVDLPADTMLVVVPTKAGIFEVTTKDLRNKKDRFDLVQYFSSKIDPKGLITREIFERGALPELPGGNIRIIIKDDGSVTADQQVKVSGKQGRM